MDSLRHREERAISGTGMDRQGTADTNVVDYHWEQHMERKNILMDPFVKNRFRGKTGEIKTKLRH